MYGDGCIDVGIWRWVCGYGCMVIGVWMVYGYGCMDMGVWIWVYGYGCKDMGGWIGAHGYGCLVVCWRWGIRDDCSVVGVWVVAARVTDGISATS